MRAKIYLLAMLTFILSGCSSRGYVSPNLEIPKDKRALYVSSYFSGYEERHVGTVVRVFEKYGFTPVKEIKDSNYQLSFTIEGGGVVSVKIGLLQGSNTLIEVESSNAGWGTVIARPAAIASRVEAAIIELEKVLQERNL